MTSASKLGASLILGTVVLVGLDVTAVGHAAAGAGDDVHAKWTDSLGEPSVYVNYARVEVDQKSYQSAARKLRKAAAILAQRLSDTYGLDRRQLVDDVAALRLTARDVEAGAITSSAQLDGVLDTTLAYLAKRGSASR